MSKPPNITVEDRLRSYLDKEAKLFVGDQILSRFYSWQKKVLQPVTLKPISEIAGAQRLIDDAGEYNYFEPKRCYDNALQLAVSSFGKQETNYVEGFVVINEHLLFGHAWNSTAGRHFDYTTELINALLAKQGVPFPTRHFFKVVELPLQEAYPHTLTAEVPIQLLHFLKQNGLSSSARNIDWAIPSGEHLS